jgi:threonylcarbamoyladenosine tRNA methylthiotransferase MtaB
MKVTIFTLGCKLNQCESEAIADSFAKEGFEVVPTDGNADLYIVNTCTVTAKAEQKGRRMIRKFAKEKQVPLVLVTGCYAQLEKEELQQLSERVVVVSLDDKPSLLSLPQFLANRLVADLPLKETILEFVKTKLNEEDKIATSPFDYDATAFSFHSRAFLKIQDGCDNECAFCRVTIARGDAISLEHEEVVKRSLLLVDQGYKEIVLTGVNISAYKSDALNLASLLTLLLEKLPQDVRIRLSSLEPDRLDDSLIDLFSDKRIQSHFHLPIQSASDIVLQKVNRLYDVKRLYAVVASLRRVKNNPFIAADIITGLPGESDEEFEKSFNVLKDLSLSQLHVFPFSIRPQTALFETKERVPERIRDERAQILRTYSANQMRLYTESYVGKVVEVVLEDKKERYWNAISGNYLKVKVPHQSALFRRGALVEVLLEKESQQGSLIGGLNTTVGVKAAING